METNDYCVRNSTPDLILPPFTDLSYVEAANKRPGNSSFSLSYVDCTIPNVVFISLVSSYKIENTNPIGPKFDKAVAFDMSASTISAVLKDIEKRVANSVSFVIESETDFVIASKLVIIQWLFYLNSSQYKPCSFHHC